MSTAQLNGLIAPRAHLSIIGQFDPHTPKRGVDRDEAALREQYEKQGVPERWKLLRYPVGHVETEEMRFDALEFLRRNL